MTTEQAREFSEQLVAEHFGRHSNSAKAFELSKDGPKYSRMKKQAVLDKLIATPPVWSDPDYRKRFDPVQKSEADLRLLADAALCADAQKYFGPDHSTGGADNVSTLAAKRPDYWRQVRSCAIAKGFIEDRPVQPVPEPKPKSQFFRLSDEIADQAGLPHGYMCNADSLGTILKVLVETKERKAEADALAAKTQDQLDRDRAADESAATFGRLLEINRAHSAKQNTTE
jgi:hypothetical protein